MTEMTVLLAMRGAAEESFLRQISESGSLRVIRRCADGQEVLAASLAGVGDIAIIDPQLGVNRSFLQRLKSANTTPVIATTSDEQAHYEAMGAHVVLAGTEDLVAELNDLLQTSEPRPPVEEEGPLAQAQVCAVMSGWGSPGRTTVAVNLAAGIAARGGNPLLIDADVWGASVKQYLGLDPDGVGIAAAIRGVERGTLDMHGLSRLTEESYGIQVLGGLNRSDRWKEVSGPSLPEFWNLVKTWQGQVIIDAPVRIPTADLDDFGSFGPTHNSMWDSIQEIMTQACLVGTADTVGIHRFVNFHLDGWVTAPHIVINRVRGSAAGPRPEQSVVELLARFAGISEAHLIPEDPAVDRSILEAKPLIRSGKSPARDAFEELTDRFVQKRSRERHRSKFRPRRVSRAH